MILFKLFCICFICVAIIDCTDFMDSLKGGISWLVFGQKFYDWRLKPFDCSLCMSLWLQITYLLVAGSFTLPLLAYSLLLSIMTPVLFEFTTMIKNLLLKIINYVDKRGN